MYLSRCNVLCSLAIIFSFLTSQAGEQTRAIIRPIQSPASAMMSLASIIQQHKNISYSEKELRDIGDFIRLYKDHINIHIASTDGCNKNNLAIAIQHEQLPIVELLRNHGAKLTSVAAQGNNLKDAIRLCPLNNLDMFITLLAADIDAPATINKKDNDGDTVLHDLLRAIDDGTANIETIKQKTCWLMWYGANPNLADDDDATAITIVEDEASFDNPVDQQDFLDILHQGEKLNHDRKENSYYQKFVSHLLCTMTKGVNVATYTDHKAIYAPSQHHQRPQSDATYTEKETLNKLLRAMNAKATDTIAKI